MYHYRLLLHQPEEVGGGLHTTTAGTDRSGCCLNFSPYTANTWPPSIKAFLLTGEMNEGEI